MKIQNYFDGASRGGASAVTATLIAAFVLCASPIASAQTKSFALKNVTPLLEETFYTKGTPETTDDVFVLNVAVNNAGTIAAFMTTGGTIYLVDVGDPTSVRILNSPFASLGTLFIPMVWTPDDSAILAGSFKINAATGNLAGPVELTPGIIQNAASVTRLPADNYHAQSGQLGLGTPGTSELLVLPILPNGNKDSSRVPVQVTNFGSVLVSFAYIANDASSMAFAVADAVFSQGDVYVLTELQDIISGATSAPTSLSDPRIKEIRASETTNVALCPALSADGSLAFVCEDFNGIFDGLLLLTDPTLPGTDFDIVISNADGSSVDFRIENPGTSEGLLTPFPTGSRLTFVRAAKIFATELEVTTDIAASSSDLNDEGGTTATIGGQTVDLGITLTDSAVQTTTAVELEDGSGTSIDLVDEQVVNFPQGSLTDEITITTPIDPVTEAQLPPDAPVDAIPVVREFGPEGTQFFPPIAITITYSDAEVEGLDVSMLTPFLFNTMTGVFDIAVDEADIVRDPDNNAITFFVDHFSTYGLGAERGVGMPIGGRPAAWVLLALLAVASVTAIRRSGRQR